VRDIILVLATLGFLPLCFRYPAAGVICWIWISIMSPHRLVWGFAAGQQFNFVIALVTLLGWFLSKEARRWTPDLTPKLLLALTAWMTFASFFSLFPPDSWSIWDQTMRTLALIFLVFFVVKSKARIHGAIWALVISVGYYGVKGGLFTIATGGNFRVLGPGGTMLADNNNLALAVVMTFPLLNYLRLHTKHPALRIGLMVGMFLEVVMVLGTHSRGGAVALAAMLVAFWMMSRHKVGIAIVGVPIIALAVSLMPDMYFRRLDTIEDLTSDSSFMGRVQAWQVAIGIAIKQFPFGAGFSVAQRPEIFHSHLPGVIPHAAHSVYFQVLGDHGFIGLALYLWILAVALLNTWLIPNQTRNRPGLQWASDLAVMIRVALIGYSVGGAALSMAYFDGFLLLIALLSPLREITRPETTLDSSASRFAGPQTRPGNMPQIARLPVPNRR
jgi:putative inorganic carbon (hco3(-)) transporter